MKSWNHHRGFRRLGNQFNVLLIQGQWRTLFGTWIQLKRSLLLTHYHVSLWSETGRQFQVFFRLVKPHLANTLPIGYQLSLMLILTIPQLCGGGAQVSRVPRRWRWRGSEGRQRNPCRVYRRDWFPVVQQEMAMGRLSYQEVRVIHSLGHVCKRWKMGLPWMG